MKRATSQCAHWWQRWSCKWIDFESGRCTNESQNHTQNFTRQEFVTLRYTVSFDRISSLNARRSVVRKNSLLQTVRCNELANENCFVVSQHLLWTSLFHWQKYFHCGARMTRLCATDDTRNANWVINFSVGFCCVMFMSTVAALGVFSVSATI